MRKISAILVLTFSVFTGILFQSCQSTKSSTSSKMLSFNFEKGKGYDYEMTTSMDQEMMGQQMKMDMVAYYSMNTIEDNGGVKTIASTFDRMKMNMDVGPMKIDIDTDKPIETKDTSEMSKAFGMLNKVFGAIKGRKFQMKVDAEGKVTEVTGFKEMAQSMVDSIGLNLSEAEKTQMRQQFETQFNDESTKSQFERMFYIFPNKKVSVGDSWTKDLNTTGPMGGKYSSTYTVKEIEGDMVTLEEKSVIGANDDKMELSGTVTGTSVVDSRSGLIVTSTQNMNMSAKVQGKTMGIKGITKIKGKAN